MTTWYREGLVTLTAGSDLVAGVGTEWVDNVLPGGIFFTPAGLVEVERVISDISLKLVTPYGGATVASAEYSIAPTQGYVVALAKQLNSVLGDFGELKDAWQDGTLVGKGVALKGVKNTIGELPGSGNVQGDAWMVDGHLHVWTGSVWLDQGATVSTPELEALRDAAGTSAGLAIGAALTVDTNLKDLEDRIYPGIYATPPTSKPHSGAPSADGDRCVALVGSALYEHLRTGGGWLIPNIDAANLGSADGTKFVRHRRTGLANAVTLTVDGILADRSISPTETGAVGDGVADDTLALQRAFDDGRHVICPPGAIYKTTAMLFNQKHERTIDLNGAKLLVTSSSVRYAIVSASPMLTDRTTAGLATFCSQLHYGEELKNSHVRNFDFQMGAKTSTGANLGIGFVYAERCTFSRTHVLSTNGNGVEFRNSIACELLDSVVDGHRAYGVFNFQSKGCRTARCVIRGGMRGWISKHSHNGSGLTENILEDCELYDASTNGRWVIGGEWFENALTDAIYVPGHEVVRGNIIRRNRFYAVNGTEAPRISLGYYADQWKVYENDFYCASKAGNVWVTGSEGNITDGGTIGGNHEFYRNRIYDVNALSNAVLGFNTPASADENFISGAFSHLLLGDSYAGGTNALVRFTRNKVRGHVAPANASANGIVYRSTVLAHITEDNDIVLDSVGMVATGAALINGVYSAAADWSVRRNNIVIQDLPGGTHTSAYGSLITAGFGGYEGNTTTLGASAQCIGAQFTNGVSPGASAAQNAFNLVGTSTLARALVTDVEIRQLRNTFAGSWVTRVFNNSPYPAADQRRTVYSDALPVAGTWERGDEVKKLSVVAGVSPGWVCTTAGIAGSTAVFKATSAIAA